MQELGYDLGFSPSLDEIYKVLVFPKPRDFQTRTLCLALGIEHYKTRNRGGEQEGVQTLATTGDKEIFFKTMIQAADFFQTNKFNIRLSIDKKEPIPFKGELWYFFKF